MLLFPRVAFLALAPLAHAIAASLAADDWPCEPDDVAFLQQDVIVYGSAADLANSSAQPLPFPRQGGILREDGPTAGLLATGTPSHGASMAQTAQRGSLFATIFFADVPYCTVELYTDKRPDGAGQRRIGLRLSLALIGILVAWGLVGTCREHVKKARDSSALSSEQALAQYQVDEEVVPKRRVSEEELRQHCTRGDLWVSLDGIVYDASDVVQHHPGGPEVLLEHAGKEVGDAIRSVGHSAFAVSRMKRMPVGFLDPAPRQWQCCGISGPRCYTCFVVVSLFTMLFRIAFTLGAPNADAFDSGYYLGAFSTGYRGLGAALVHLGIFVYFLHQPWSFSRRYLKTAEASRQYHWRVAIAGTRQMFSFLATWVLMQYCVWRSDSPASFYWTSVSKYLILLFMLTLSRQTLGEHCMDTFRRIAVTVPFWESCPAWLEAAIVLWYELVEIQAMLAMLAVSGVNMYIMFLFSFPVQLAPLLLLLVDRGYISCRCYHLLLLWASAQVGVCFVAQLTLFWWCLSAACAIFCLRKVGVSDRSAFMCFAAADLLTKAGFLGCPGMDDQTALHRSEAAVAVLIWAAWYVFIVVRHSLYRPPLQEFFNDDNKKLMRLSSIEQVSETLFLLSFELPQRSMCGHAPGQHVRISTRNISFTNGFWNRVSNFEADAQEISRCYAPVSSPGAETLELLVKRYPPDAAKGFPDGGRVSLALVDRLMCGDIVEVAGHFGSPIYDGAMRFRVRHGEAERVVQAQRCAALVGGSGVSAALGLLRTLREERTGKRAAVETSEKEPHLSVVQVVRSAAEALPSKWFAGGSPTCTSATVATQTLEAKAHVDKAAVWEATMAEVRRVFPEPGPNVVVLVAGPHGFVTKMCRPMLADLGYENVIELL